MFLFFDTENSGLSRNFSQLLEIAFIATDSDLNMMSSRQLSSKRLPWNIPSPGAMLVTGIMPENMKKQSDTHYEMMCKVNEYLQNLHWPIIFAGYNVHGYDHGILSQNLHQTLHDPFVMTGRKSWQAPANKIFDILDVVKATHIYAPSALTLDIKSASGRYPSMSLGNVARQNGIDFSENDAHGALADTKATIKVARMLKAAAPRIWDQMLKMSDRQNVQAFLDQNEVFAYSQCPYGAGHNIIGTYLTDANGSRTEAVIWDLNVDPADYLDKTEDELTEIFRLRGDKRFATPLQTLMKHKQPILMPLDMAGPVSPYGLGPKTIEGRLKTIKNNPEFAAKVARAAQKAKPKFKPGQEPEEKIYNFPDKRIRKSIDEWKIAFHAADWGEKTKLIAAFKKTFAKDIKKDPALERFIQFAKRIVYADAPETLSKEEKIKYDTALHARRHSTDEEVPYMTLIKARQELATIEQERAKGAPQWKHVTDSQIRSIKLFYTALEKEFGNAPDISNDNKPLDPPKHFSQKPKN